MAAKTATTKIYLDKRHESNEDTFYVKLRVTYERKPKYYPTEIKLTEEQFQKVMFGKKKTTAEKELFLKLNSFETKALDCIKRIPYFTFEQFEKHYISNRGATDSVEKAYSAFIAALRAEERFGNANTYITSCSSLSKFKKDLRFVDITPSFLRSYETYMKSNNKSVTTIGIYLKPLRSIFNTAIGQEIIDKSLYPFGKGKYEMPSSNNSKRALTAEQIGNLIRYKGQSEKEELAKDIWTFSYFCNGMNVADILNLKRKDIQGEYIQFIREKTKRSKRNVEPITVHLKNEAIRVIEKYCGKSVEQHHFLFPILSGEMTTEYRGKKVKMFTKIINQNLEKIRIAIGIPHKITTYSARHSFATALKRKGVGTAFISDCMGHSNITTTQKYLGSFEDEAIKKYTDFLLPT